LILISSQQDPGCWELIVTDISRKEESRLINQILETNRSFSYEEAIACLESFIAGLSGGGK